MKTVKELAEEMNLSTRTVYRLIASGKLGAINVGSGGRRSLRVPSDSVDTFVHINNDLYSGNRRRRVA